MSAADPDVSYMRQALALARQGLGLTSPNPAVGALLVLDGRVVGQGWHQRAGQAHAEVEALRQAGERARGATLYVTLEPCRHHGRTPPCAEAVARAGVARVVSALHDPDPRVDGGGHAYLREAGLEVREGVLEAEARELNRFFVTSICSRRPYVTLKVAMTADGRTETRAGHSQWITGPAARSWVHEQRALHDGVLVGVGTVLADDPRLDVRLDVAGEPAGSPRARLAARQPWRIVLDALARTPSSARVLDPTLGPTLVCVSQEAPPRDRQRLQGAGARVVELASLRSPEGVAAVLEHLHGLGLRSVFVEGGSRVHASFVASGLVDCMLAFVAPCVVGGGDASPPALAWSVPGGAAAGAAGLATPPSLVGCPPLLAAQQRRLEVLPPRVLGPDILLELRLVDAS